MNTILTIPPGTGNENLNKSHFYSEEFMSSKKQIHINCETQRPQRRVFPGKTERSVRVHQRHQGVFLEKGYYM
jgi:hypothetical protein